MTTQEYGDFDITPGKVQAGRTVTPADYMATVTKLRPFITQSNKQAIWWDMKIDNGPEAGTEVSEMTLVPTPDMDEATATRECFRFDAFRRALGIGDDSLSFSGLRRVAVGARVIATITTETYQGQDRNRVVAIALPGLAAASVRPVDDLRGFI